ncbi:septum formation family protein [Nocardioides baculatus]|uniref:Septum formation family protein n=1 Tax=Nocardioides baculatus TaxID=2801337 RepID=A0ABS1LD82_9ACTN|nr:septum formation family protein [Nocardioides baculatus]MBL0749649.1 septum formation family protein [Nocardioides baculatus]
MRTLVALAALVLALSGCTSSPTKPVSDTPSPSASTTPTETTPPPDPGPTPKVGECHLLSFGQAVNVVGRTEPVKCKRKHTAETYFVGRLKLATKAGHVRRVDSQAAQKQARTTCAARLPKHLGRTPRELRLTLARSVYFTPPPQRAEAGADWFRCDVVVVAGPRRLLTLPRATKGFGAAPAVAMCATAAPGTTAFKRVGCAAKHAWRAVSTVDLPGKRLPSKGAVADLMDGPCGDAARESAADPLDFTWSQESPTQEQWDAGQRYGICWVPA